VRCTSKTNEKREDNHRSFDTAQRAELFINGMQQKEDELKRVDNWKKIKIGSTVTDITELTQRPPTAA